MKHDKKKTKEPKAKFLVCFNYKESGDDPTFIFDSFEEAKDFAEKLLSHDPDNYFYYHSGKNDEQEIDIADIVRESIRIYEAKKEWGVKIGLELIEK